MYFRRFPFKMPICLSQPLTKSYTVAELSLNKINSLLNEFIKQSNKFVKLVKKYGIENYKQIQLLKRYQEFYKKFNNFVTIIHRIAINYDCNISKFFKEAKHILISRRWFFDFKKKISKMISYRTNNFIQYFYKSRRPHRIKYFYSSHVRHFVCSFWYSYLKSKDPAFMNFNKFMIETF